MVDGMGDDAAERRALWQLHTCVLLWGFTAILGKLITLPTSALVVWRMGLAAAILAMLPQAWRGLRAMPTPHLTLLSGIGAIIALHWLAFYGSIRLANASVAVACVALGSVFAAVIEPWITGRPHRRSELLLGVLVLPGVLLLVGGVPLEMRPGIAVGIVAALLAALFAALNKRHATGDPAEAVALLQMAAGCLTLVAGCTLAFGAADTLRWPSLPDLGWLSVLAAACTVLTMLLWLRALPHISAFTTQLALNLEPVYAILLAALWFREYEQLTPLFYLGTALVLITVFAQPRLAVLLREEPI
ncbi:MAG: DMT family transporter [Gammaproteobacteria bacterium]